MKQINQFITEYIIKKKLDKPIDSEDHYDYFPETKEELIENIKECFNNEDYNLNCIDTSKITDMSNLFRNIVNNKEDFNFDVSKWDVYNVKDMSNMFANYKNFDCDLSSWDVSNVEDMSDIFANCKSFKGKGLENWDVSNVKKMNYMFDNCLHFDCDLNNWDVSNVIDMTNMFYKCDSLKNKPTWYKE